MGLNERPPARAGRFDAKLASFPTYDVVSDGSIRLRGSRCSECASVAYPRRRLCLECGADHVESALSGRGLLHAVTFVGNPPPGFDVSYWYACVDLVEGPRLLATIGGPAYAGDAVQAIAADVRDGDAGFVFGVLDA